MSFGFIFDFIYVCQDVSPAMVQVTGVRSEDNFCFHHVGLGAQTQSVRCNGILFVG